MRKGLCLLLLACLLFASSFAEEGQRDAVLLHLSFDEGQGAVVRDLSGNLQEADIQYQYLAPAYVEPMDPEWRAAGVEGGSLLFDGCSTCIAYAPEEICVSGSAMSVSAWVAPRAFEWDDPNGEYSGNAHLTAIAGQYYKGANQGFLLGYQRFGRLCFEVGTGEDWFTLWADDERLARGEWNHVAAVFDGEAGRMTLYLNGEKASSTPVFPDSVIEPAVNERLLIGKNGYGEQIPAGNYQMFAGMMDELELFGAALGPDEIAALADRETAPIPYDQIALENILTGDPGRYGRRIP